MGIKDYLLAMADRLTLLGYGEVLSSFMPIQQPYSKWYAAYCAADEELKPLLELFLLSRAVRPERLDPVIAECIEGLAETALFTTEEDGSISTTGFVLQPTQGLWLFHQKPCVGISLYFSEDSIALLTRQRPIRGGWTLDLCSGPGVQGLYGASRGENVIGVEINSVAASLAEINAMMNDLDDLYEVRVGDLYRPVEGLIFDRITANPPLLPFPEELPYPFVGHGGADGFSVTWKIIEGISAHLTDSGYAQLLGVGLGDRGANACFLPKMRRLAEECGLDILVTLTGHIPMRRGDRFFEGMVDTSNLYCGISREIIADKLDACLRSQNAEYYLPYYLLVRKGSGTVRLQDLSGGRAGLWYV